MVHFPDYHMLPGDNLVLNRGNKSTNHLVVNLQAWVAFKLLLGVVNNFQNKSVASSIDGKHSGLNWSLGILAESTTTSEIFCKHLLLTCVSFFFYVLRKHWYIFRKTIQVLIAVFLWNIHDQIEKYCVTRVNWFEICIRLRFRGAPQGRKPKLCIPRLS